MSVPTSPLQAASGTDPAATLRRRSTRRLTIILLALVGASCLAAVVFAGALMWRSAPTLISEESSTPTLIRGATPTRETAGAVPTRLPSAQDDEEPAEGGLTDPELKTRVWSTIVSFYTHVRACTDIQGGDIRVTKQPDSLGSWEETWEVTACGEDAALKIHFTATSDGGIFYDITE